MRKSILVKPDLKLILLGALVIAVLHDVFTKGMSESALLNHDHPVSWISDAELTRIIDQVDASPNTPGYMRISEAYEKRGDMRRALYYIKKAQAMGPLEELED